MVLPSAGGLSWTPVMPRRRASRKCLIDCRFFRIIMTYFYLLCLCVCCFCLFLSFCVSLRSHKPRDSVTSYFRTVCFLTLLLPFRWLKKVGEGGGGSLSLLFLLSLSLSLSLSLAVSVSLFRVGEERGNGPPKRGVGWKLGRGDAVISFSGYF